MVSNFFFIAIIFILILFLFSSNSSKYEQLQEENRKMREQLEKLESKKKGGILECLIYPALVALLTAALSGQGTISNRLKETLAEIIISFFN